MFHFFRLSLLVLLTSILVACGTNTPGPNAEKVQSEIYSHFLKYNGGQAAKSTFKVDNFEVLTVENIGNSVDEKIVGRFSGELLLTEPIYKVIERLPDGTNVLEVAQSEGLRTPISGTYSSVVESVVGKEKFWKTEIEYDEVVENRWEGRPLAYFQQAVIKGSSEHEGVVAEIAAERKAEEERRAAAQAEYLRKKKAWLDDLSGVWLADNVTGYRTSRDRSDCARALGAKGEDFKIAATITIPSNLEDGKKIPISAKLSSSSYPGYIQDVPMIVELSYEKSKNLGVRTMYLAVAHDGNGAYPGAYKCPKQASQRFAGRDYMEDVTVRTLTEFSGQPKDGVLVLNRHGYSNAVAGTLRKQK